MLKKLTGLVLVSSFFLLQACGTLLKSNAINKPHSDKLDTSIVILDALGLLLFIVPGVVAFAVDYSNGTLFVSGHGSAKLDNTNPKTIQAALAKYNIKVSLDELQKAQKMAYNSNPKLAN
ncbi:hypothetical protein ACFX5K_03805 [Rickettsiales bacterium LUAb2]